MIVLLSTGSWKVWGVLALCLAALTAVSPAGAATAERSDTPRKTVASGKATGQAGASTAKSPKGGVKAKTGKAAAGASQPGAGKASRTPSRKANTKTAARKGKRGTTRVVRAAPPRPSVGQLAGLHRVSDVLELKSSVALIIDQDSGEALYSKNAQAVLPIASLTKLMTALVVAEADQSLTEVLEISQADVDTERHSRSRLRVGTRLSREEMLHLALMSSENRAAHALGRHYPGGLPAFVKAMNRKAKALGMAATRYDEPTGLSSDNRSNARDLAKLVNAAHGHRLIRELSVSPDVMVDVGARQVHYVNTNRLVRSATWEIGLQKTGYISEAGRCLVMQASLNGRRLIMVFLDSAGKYSRLGDAERVRRWLAKESGDAAATEDVEGDEVEDGAEEGGTAPKLTS